MKKTQLTPYLAAGAATLSAGQADAATIVTLYGPGAQSPSTDPATPAGIDIGMFTFPLFYALDPSDSAASVFGYQTSIGYFTSGSDISVSLSYYRGLYTDFTGGFISGATGGDQNYANISFDGNDGVYEAVGQFNFTGDGSGYLVAIAENDDGSALSISAGKAAIDAIPEPTTAGLLALGAAGLATLRRRKRA